MLWPHGQRVQRPGKGVQLAIADAAESVDHLGDPEHALRSAMTRQ